MTDFYVSSAGSDSNDGTAGAPWKTITRLNTALATMPVHNRFFLHRGDTLYGRIALPASLDGALPGWVKIGAYGESPDLPVVSGYKIATTWTAHDADTWKLDYQAANVGITYTGYDSAQGDGDVGFLKIDGVIHGSKKSSLGALAAQWDFYSTGTTLYVRSTADPSTLATDIRFTVDGKALSMRGATEVADLSFVGVGGHGVQFSGGKSRARLLGCTIAEMGGSYLDGFGDGTTRYGNGVEVWDQFSDAYCERNTIRDCFDTAWTIQGTATTSRFADITWRRNLTYRNTQAEEYWCSGSTEADPITNCVSEYNTNLFPGYGWGPDVRDNPQVKVAVLSFTWNMAAVDLTLRRNIYYDAPVFTYKAQAWPSGMSSRNNIIALRPGAKMQYQTSQTVENADDWTTEALDGTSRIAVLPASADTSISDADVTTAITALDYWAKTGQFAGDRILPIHAPWRAT